MFPCQQAFELRSVNSHCILVFNHPKKEGISCVADIYIKYISHSFQLTPMQCTCIKMQEYVTIYAWFIFFFFFPKYRKVIWIARFCSLLVLTKTISHSNILLLEMFLSMFLWMQSIILQEPVSCNRVLLSLYQLAYPELYIHLNKQLIKQLGNLYFCFDCSISL